MCVAATHHAIELRGAREGLRRHELLQDIVAEATRDRQDAHDAFPDDEPARRLDPRALDDVRRLVVLGQPHGRVGVAEDGARVAAVGGENVPAPMHQSINQVAQLSLQPPTHPL